MKPHGTRAAYYRHLRAKEDPCELCRAANSEYQRERNRGLGVKPFQPHEHRHGTFYEYMRCRCRCPECRAANARQQADWRARVAGQPPPRHGTHSAYNNWSCRCAACREAQRIYNRPYAEAYRARQRSKAS